MKKQFVFLNERALKFREALVINSDGSSLGVIPTRKALDLAKNEGLDLYVANPNASPVVCKILDYGQMRYEEQKRERANHKPKQDTKEIKVSPRIQKHDIETFVKRAIKFLEHGDKVKVSCFFKSRELDHPELGLAKIKIVLDELSNYCVYEGEPVLQGKIMSIIVSPKK
jgi:translation initiation factor IF-3